MTSSKLLISAPDTVAVLCRMIARLEAIKTVTNQRGENSTTHTFSRDNIV